MHFLHLTTHPARRVSPPDRRMSGAGVYLIAVYVMIQNSSFVSKRERKLQFGYVFYTFFPVQHRFCMRLADMEVDG